MEFASRDLTFRTWKTRYVNLREGGKKRDWRCEEEMAEYFLFLDRMSLLRSPLQVTQSEILFSKNVSIRDWSTYNETVERNSVSFPVFHWNSSRSSNVMLETKKYPLTCGLTAHICSLRNPCGTCNTHTRCLRGLSRKNSDNKRKITHALERLLHRGPCHVFVQRRPLYFWDDFYIGPRYRGLFGVVHLAAIKMRDAGRNGIDINRFACGTTRVRPRCRVWITTSKRTRNCACENRIDTSMKRGDEFWGMDIFRFVPTEEICVKMLFYNF